MVGAWWLAPLVVALAWPFAASSAPGAPALRISAAPARLHLASGSRATLRVACAREPPVLAASVGRIDALDEVASGVYQAEFVPPDSLDPQVAFVTVQCAEAFGWVPIPLSGIRDLTVAARHGTPVSVSVEGDQFGPVPADATGRAVVRVVVPLGARVATHRNQKIDLAVRSPPLLHVALDRAEVDANAGGAVVVRALSVDERGAPAPRAQLDLNVSEGDLGPTVEVEPGVLQATWRLAPGGVHDAFVTARRHGRPGTEVTAVVARRPGSPREVSLEVGRTALVAGEGEELEVASLVTDVGGHPTDAPATLAVSSPGTILEWERAGTGRHVGRVLVPSRRAGRAELELEVVAAEALRGRRTVALLPGPAQQVRVEPRGELFADGRSRELRVSVLDASDNRVDVPDPPIVSAGRGETGDPDRYGPGAYRVDYRAPLAAEDFQDVVRVSVGEIEGEQRLRVRALGGGVTLAPKIGLTVATGGLLSLAGGGELGLWGRSLHGLGLLLEARAFSFDRTDTVRGLVVRSKASFAALEAALAWRRPRWGGLGWLAAGGGAAWAGGTVSASGQAELAAEGWAPAAHATAGWGRRLGPGLPFAEVTFAWQGDPGDGPLDGALRSLTFSVGYKLDVL